MMTEAVPAVLPGAPANKQRPAFIITMDAEGDNLWESPEVVTTINAKYLDRFQSLCERYGLKPTWLTNYEMAQCPAFGEFADDVLLRENGEIGMHLHAWDSPPLSRRDPGGQAYLIEFPESVMREKIAFLTDCIEDRFGIKMLSHRAGRWAFNSIYAHLLAEFGYRVDCSVTPHVSWAKYPGDPKGVGGTDFRGFPSQPYFMDLDNIDKAGNSSLLEVPVSVLRFGNGVSWLRPGGDNIVDMLTIMQRAENETLPCVEFMLHSSELMPGGSPTFSSKESIEALYDDLEAVFSRAQERFRPATLAEFRTEFKRTKRA